MTADTAVHDDDLEPGRCWCCGSLGDPQRMVHLGLHPDVVLCLGCARWAAKEAGAIEDRDRTGVAARARDAFRALRQRVVHQGWHRSRYLGPPLRWLGRRLP